MNQDMFTKLFKDGILMDVNVRFWSAAKALSASDLGLKESDVAKAFHLGRKMLIPAEVIQDFRRIESRARRLVEVNSFHFPIGNARFIPKKKFSKVHKELNEFKEQYNALTEKLVENYEAYRLQMIPVYQEAAETAFLKSQPSEKEFSIEGLEKEKEEFINAFMARIQAYYPPASSLREKFDLNWDVFEVAMPKMEAGDAEEIADGQEKAEIAKLEYQKQVQDKMSGFVSEVVTTLRSQAIDLCNKVAENLKGKKVVHSRSLQSLRDYIDNFKELNFVGDTTVEAQLETFKKEFLDVHDAKTINESVDLQEELSRKISSIVDVVSNVNDLNDVTGDYKRKVSWE